MDSQMQARFLQHMLTFFSMKPEDGGTADAVVDHDAGDNLHGPEQRCPDLPELLGLLRATGFSVQYSDKSDWGGSSHGCRAVIMCKRSGTRVVMDGDGPCTCPPEATLKQYLEQSRAGPPLSRASSPTPSTSSMLEASLHGHADQGPTLDVPPPALSRQRTWSRDDNAILEEGPAASPTNRRLSAPPLQMSAWTTMNGDELNVMAATDLLQEAMSLLSGVKKVNLRNTPVGPSRRLSGTAASRRLSSDAFVMPMRPLSRTSSASSGLASSRSTSSLQSTQSTQSTQSSHYGDTPRPPRPGREVQAGTTTTTLRRTASVNGGRVGGASSAPKTPVARVRTKSDVAKTGVGESSTTSTNTRIPGSKTSLIKPPSAVGVGKPTPRIIARPGIKTNASLTTTRPIQPKQIVKSPEVESIKL